MDDTTFRILDILSRKLGSDISINELTKQIKELHGSAHYKNIYEKCQELTRQKLITLSRIGKSSIAKLNFSNYLLTDFLAETENIKKRSFLEKRIDFQNFLEEIESFASGFASISTICLINPEKNARLNKAEFLFLLQPFPYREIRQSITKTVIEEFRGEKLEEQLWEDIAKIHSLMQIFQKTYNIKADCLILKKEEFLGLLRSKEKNPLPEMLANKIAFFRPHDFWTTIKQAKKDGIEIKTEETDTGPAQINEKTLAYNLSGSFGYAELGAKIEEAPRQCIESISTAILIREDARRTEAIPAVLAKAFKQPNQRKPSYGLLLFLCQKYGQIEKLFGLLQELNKNWPNPPTQNALKLLESLKIKPKKTDSRAIKQKMELYHAI